MSWVKLLASRVGLPVAVTDVDRKVLERIDFEPFGKVVNVTPKDGPGFTGHVFDAATGMLCSSVITVRWSDGSSRWIL